MSETKNKTLNIPGGFYWFYVDDGWRIGELDSEAGEVYWCGTERMTATADMHGVKIEGPIPAPVSSLVLGISPGLEQDN